MKDKIVAEFDQHVLKRSALSIRDGEGVFREILGGGKYRRIVEIGTYRGVSAAAMAQFCDRVMTIDLKQGRMEQLGESWNRDIFWAALGVRNVDLHLVNENSEKAALIKTLDFDFAFIDGAHHSIEEVKFDFDLVKRCGTVLFHDYDRRGTPEKDCVCDFVDSLPKHQVKTFDLFALWTA